MVYLSKNNVTYDIQKMKIKSYFISVFSFVFLTYTQNCRHHAHFWQFLCDIFLCKNSEKENVTDSASELLHKYDCS